MLDLRLVRNEHFSVNRVKTNICNRHLSRTSVPNEGETDARKSKNNEIAHYGRSVPSGAVSRTHNTRYAI